MPSLNCWLVGRLFKISGNKAAIGTTDDAPEAALTASGEELERVYRKLSCELPPGLFPHLLLSPSLAHILAQVMQLSVQGMKVTGNWHLEIMLMWAII
jgi:hypothetical protein